MLTSKLKGHLPLTEDDPIRKWLSGERRLLYLSEALWDQPFRIPSFPSPHGQGLP
jgi:hypothetical protein